MLQSDFCAEILAYEKLKRKNMAKYWKKVSNCLLQPLAFARKYITDFGLKRHKDWILSALKSAQTENRFLYLPRSLSILLLSPLYLPTFIARKTTRKKSSPHMTCDNSKKCWPNSPRQIPLEVVISDDFRASNTIQNVYLAIVKHSCSKSFFFTLRFCVLPGPELSFRQLKKVRTLLSRFSANFSKIAITDKGIV